MYNLRYHLASLISVFFALTIGLLLGGLVADRAPENVHEALFEGIQQEIAQVREDNAQLRAENGAALDFSDVLLDAFVQGALDERTILVLGADDQELEIVMADLEKAGATTVHAIPTLSTAQGDEGAEWELQSNVALQQLDLYGIVNIFEPAGTGGEYLSDYFVYLRELQDYYEAPLIFMTSDQTETGGGDLVTYAWEEDFSGSNQLGEPYGAFTLIVLLASDAQGKYGSIENATALYPVIPDDFFEQLTADATAEDEATP